MKAKKSVYLKLVEEIMENMPEYSSYSELKCTSWKYEEGLYQFTDYYSETEPTPILTLTVSNCEESMKQFLIEIMDGNLHFCGLDPRRGDNLFEPCNWDAMAVDAFVQYKLLGDVLYG